MIKLEAYLTFGGNCEEAINFYQSCFGGEITLLEKFGDSPMDVPESHKDKIMHTTLVTDAFRLLASDGMPDFVPASANNVSLSLELNDNTVQDKIYDKLSEGGVKSFPPQDTSWNSRFGMLTDKFGINWMLSVNHPQK